MQPYQETFQSKGQAFTIRTPRVEDAAALIAYIEVIDRETTFLSREPGEFAQNVTLEKEQAFLRSCLEDEGQLFLIVEDGDGSIAATCNCSSMARRQRHRHRAELGISVKQAYWRQGLGRRMMELLEEWAAAQGIEKLALEVDTQNFRAIGLYLSKGYTVEGTLRHTAKMADGTYRDYYAMAKFL